MSQTTTQPTNTQKLNNGDVVRHKSFPEYKCMIISIQTLTNEINDTIDYTYYIFCGVMIIGAKKEELTKV